MIDRNGTNYVHAEGGGLWRANPTPGANELKVQRFGKKPGKDM